MANISILIVDDDLSKISSIINTILEAFSETLLISQASSVQEAIGILQKREFHLLITDFQMPIRINEPPDNNAGQLLIKQLYRKKTLVNVPMYIVGLTQFDYLKKAYNGVWKVWKYDATSDDWKSYLRDLIHHISLVKSRLLTEKKETIFVEGFIDKLLLERTLHFFYPKLQEKITIETIDFSGGASWVERQLFIWGKTLTKKKGSSEYLKAVGLFDNDKAGLKAIDNIKKHIPEQSAESKTFSIVRTSYKYSPLLKSIKAKGVELETTIEDLITEEGFEFAQKSNLLISRPISSIKVNNEKITTNGINANDLLSNGFSSIETQCILNKISDENKVNFSKIITKMENKNCLTNIRFLLEDILDKLKINSRD